MLEDQSKLLLIVPFFNEELRMVVEDFTSAFKDFKDADFLLLDDASSDSTFIHLETISKNFDNVFVDRLYENAGKAECIRFGLLHFDVKKYSHIAYLDADLATPFSEIFRMYDYHQANPQYHFLLGSRIKLMGNNVQRSLVRHYFGRFFATIVSQAILKVPIYDTQCGAKVIKTALALELFKTPFSTRWLFDVELLLRYQRFDKKFESKTREIPLNHWHEKGNTKIKLSEFLIIPFQLLHLHVRYK